MGGTVHPNVFTQQTLPNPSDGCTLPHRLHKTRGRHQRRRSCTWKIQPTTFEDMEFMSQSSILRSRILTHESKLASIGKRECPTVVSYVSTQSRQNGLKSVTRFRGKAEMYTKKHTLHLRVHPSHEEQKTHRGDGTHPSCTQS